MRGSVAVEIQRGSGSSTQHRARDGEDLGGLGKSTDATVGAGEPAAADRETSLVRSDPDHRARVFGDPSHVVGRDPRQRVDEVLLDVDDFVLCSKSLECRTT